MGVKVVVIIFLKSITRRFDAVAAWDITPTTNRSHVMDEGRARCVFTLFHLMGEEILAKEKNRELKRQLDEVRRVVPS